MKVLRRPDDPREGDERITPDGQVLRYMSGDWLQVHSYTPAEMEAIRKQDEQHRAQMGYRTSRFFPASDLHGQPVPEREWLVPDLIPHRTVTLLSGDGGTGKSLLALQLAVAAATEGRWIGRDVTPGGVVYLSAEDDRDELHRRLADILAHEGGDFRDLDRLTLRSLAGEDALLAWRRR